jgi:hypothetical protein
MNDFSDLKDVTAPVGTRERFRSAVVTMRNFIEGERSSELTANFRMRRQGSAILNSDK